MRAGISQDLPVNTAGVGLSLTDDLVIVECNVCSRPVLQSCLESHLLTCALNTTMLPATTSLSHAGVEITSRKTKKPKKRRIPSDADPATYPAMPIIRLSMDKHSQGSPASSRDRDKQRKRTFYLFSTAQSRYPMWCAD